MIAFHFQLLRSQHLGILNTIFFQIEYSWNQSQKSFGYFPTTSINQSRLTLLFISLVKVVRLGCCNRIKIDLLCLDLPLLFIVLREKRQHLLSHEKRVVFFFPRIQERTREMFPLINVFGSMICCFFRKSWKQSHVTLLRRGKFTRNKR